MINAHYGLYIRMKQDKIALLISSNGSSWQENVEGSVSAFTANNWHHLVLVRNGDRFDITVNNINVLSVSYGGTIAYSSSKDTGIGLEASTGGSFTSGYNWPFNGIIDEVEILSWQGVGDYYSLGTWAAQFDAGDVVDWEQMTWNMTLSSDPTLVGYWPMDEGTGITVNDSSQSGNTGTIYGAAWTDGQINDALSFDGVDDKIITTKGYNLGNNEFSIGGWVYPNSLGLSGGLVSKGIINEWYYPSHREWCFRIGWEHGVHNRLYLLLSTGGDNEDVFAGPIMNTGEWQHVAVVVRNNRVYFYRNGVETYAGAFTGTLHNYYNNVYIGKIANETGTFDGRIDELRMYNRALNAEEISRFYQMIPAATVKFRTRTADTKENLSSATWSDYYQEPGSAITSPENRWLEVEATLETINPAVTPILHSLMVGYDVVEDINVEAFTQDSQGNTVYGFEPFKITDFSLGQAKHYDLIWNTATTFAGDYQVYADLTEDGKTVAQDTDAFKVLPELGIISSVAPDKITYTSNETVTLLSRVTNESSNFTYADLIVKESITNSSGTEVFTVEKTISNLSPNASQDLKFYWDTGTTVPGDYTVTQEVLFEDTVISQVSATFQITSSIEKAVGLSGQISVNPQEANAGEEVTFSYQVTNVGNVDMENLTLKVLLVDPDTEQAVKSYPEPLASFAMGVTYKKTFIDAISLPMKKYMVIFLGEVAGVTIPIDSTWLYVKSIPATIIIKPESFNQNTGVFTAFISFPEGYDVSTITDAVCDGAPYERMTYVQGTNQMIIEFGRDKITELPLDTTFTVTGHFANGMVFHGSDTILQIIE